MSIKIGDAIEPGGLRSADSLDGSAEDGEARRSAVMAARIAECLAHDEAFIDRLAAAVAAELQPTAPTAEAPLSVREVAQLAGRSEDWVRDHRDELGLVIVGDGPRPRLMFDASAVRDRLSAGSSGSRSQEAESAVVEPIRRGRPRGSTGAGVDLLPIGGRRAA